MAVTRQGFQELTDQQSCLFCKFHKSKKPAYLNYHMLIEKRQAILQRFMDLKFSVSFTLGSENETMFCDT